MKKDFEIKRKWVYLFVAFNVAIYLAFSGALDGHGSWGIPDNINTNFKLQGDTFLTHPWTLITYAFMHGSILHILVNMVSLVQIAPIVEEFGSKALAVYGIGAVGGGLGVLALGNPAIGTVGASGALFAIIGYIFSFVEYAEYRRGVVIVLAINCIFLFVPNISWQCHLGGFLTGMALGIYFSYRIYCGERDRLLDESSSDPVKRGEIYTYYKPAFGLLRRAYLTGFDRDFERARDRFTELLTYRPTVRAKS